MSESVSESESRVSEVYRGLENTHLTAQCSPLIKKTSLE